MAIKYNAKIGSCRNTKLGVHPLSATAGYGLQVRMPET